MFGMQSHSATQRSSVNWHMLSLDSHERSDDARKNLPIVILSYVLGGGSALKHGRGLAIARFNAAKQVV